MQLLKLKLSQLKRMRVNMLTPREQFEALDRVTKEQFEKEDLIKNIYGWIKKLEYIPESHFIDNAEQFNKIESLIDELKEG
tara:strand:+ start:9787 stop:10029 length:243 start_codon:yes stop_codon:yes gene_type:complete